MTDLLLAGAHHLLVFLLAAILAAEWVLVRPGLGGDRLSLLARIDGAYGAVAVAVILVGAGRVSFGLKGWEFYVHGVVFWLKMAAFALVGLLSIRPTLRIIAWRRTAGASGSVPLAEIDAVRAWIRLEILVFALIPLLAAAMARGIGA